MNTILNTLNSISQEPLKVYIGEGQIEKLTVSLSQGIDLKRIKETGLHLPQQYIQLLTYSNGIVFFDSGDYAIYSFEEAVENQKALEYPEDILPIGYFLGDTLVMNCKEFQNNNYLYAGSSILKDEFISLGMNMNQFIEKMLLCNCACFWQEIECDKYYDFTRK